jgi:hypothetical protein
MLVAFAHRSGDAATIVFSIIKNKFEKGLLFEKGIISL